MNGASRLKQIKIYTGKCFRVFLNEKGWKIFYDAEPSGWISNGLRPLSSLKCQKIPLFVSQHSGPQQGPCLLGKSLILPEA